MSKDFQQMTVEEMRQHLLSPQHGDYIGKLRRLEEIDALTGLLTADDLTRLQKAGSQYIVMAQDDVNNLSKYQKFVKYGEDIYCYTIAKYNSRTRACKVASVFLQEQVTPAEVEQWMGIDDTLSARVKAAVEEFRDRIREEIFRRAVEGESKAVYDKDGNHITDVKVKNDKLLEKMLSANCDEYKDKAPAGVLAAGNVVFNVMNYAQGFSEDGKDTEVSGNMEPAGGAESGQPCIIEVQGEDISQGDSICEEET